MGLLSKLKWAVSCRSLLGRNASYYPDDKHKPTWRIVCDQLTSFIRYGYFEEYYYLYGFDREEMTRDRMKEYITPYRPFLYKVDRLNFQNPYYDTFQGRITGRVINQDKFYFYLFLSRLGFPTPRVLRYIRKGQVVYEDPAFLSDFDAVVKPVDGMMGHDIFFLSRRGNIFFKDDAPFGRDELDTLLAESDWIVQEHIVQHPRMAALCPTSVNTIRLHTVMDRDGHVIPFGPLQRIGRVGSLVDNWAQGGILVGIDSATGTLQGRGVLKPAYGTVLTAHPDTRVPFFAYEIPFYKEAEAMAISLHRLLYRNHSIGWDIAVTENGPVFVEGNDRWEVSMIQAVHGPLTELKKYFE